MPTTLEIDELAADVVRFCEHIAIKRESVKMLGTKSRQVAREVLQAGPVANLSQDDLEKSMEALKETCNQVQQWSKKCIVLQWFARDEIQRECERRQQDLDSAIRLLQGLATSRPENIKVKSHVNLANRVKTEAPTAVGNATGMSDAQQFPVVDNALLDILASILGNQEKKRALENLKGDQAQSVVDFLDGLIPQIDPSDTSKSWIHKYAVIALRCLSGNSERYPSWYMLRDIEDESWAGYGGFCDIHKGRHGTKNLCLKIIKVDQSKKKELTKLYGKEVILWGQLQNPNVVPFYGIFYRDEQRTQLCLISPWMDNGNIVVYLEGKPETPRKPLIHDVAKGMSYLHGKDVIHGDLKGLNILVDERGNACITDFGLSLIHSDKTLGFNPNTTESAPGYSCRWASPELLDTGQATWASDVWAFGCVCYEILTRRTPYGEYSRISDAQMIRKIAIDHQLPAHPGDHIATEPLDTVDSLMWNLMLDCWSLNPAERPNCQRILDKLNKLEESAGQGNDGLSHYATCETQNIRNTMRARTEDIIIDLDKIRRILFQIDASGGAPEQGPLASSELEIPGRERPVRILKSLLQAQHKRMALEKLLGDGAQLMMNFLSLVIQSHDLPPEFRRHTALALYQLIRNSGLYPRLHTPKELKDVSIDRSNMFFEGFADTFRGFYHNHPLCVKVVRRSPKPDLGYIHEATAKEIVISTQLRHPNILPFYGACYLPAFPNRLSLVFPWVDNGNLATFLQNHPSMRREPFIYDIISGLEYLHEESVVHGDLKGSNVLVDNIGRACITGFGLSWFADPEVSTTQSTAIGFTTRWAAPELFDWENGTPHTKASDIWAFGCVCFEVISGKLPYHQCFSDPQIILRLMKGISPAQLHEDLAPDSDKAGDEMRDLITRCWDFGPGNRPTAQTIARALEEQGLGGRTVRDDGTSNFQNVIWGDLESEVNLAAVEQLLNTLDILPDHHVE